MCESKVVKQRIFTFPIQHIKHEISSIRAICLS